MIENANKKFQDFSSCNHRLHWSFSILFKNSMICDSLLNCDRIIEVGAADSVIPHMLFHNYDYVPAMYIKYDLNAEDCIQMDVTKGIPHDNLDAIVMSELIEHVPMVAPYVLHYAYDALKPGGKLVLTTPTPRHDMDLVWPDSHLHEFTLQEIITLLAAFKITKIKPWHCRGLKSKGLDRAIESLSVPPHEATQIFIEAIKE